MKVHIENEIHLISIMPSMQIYSNYAIFLLRNKDYYYITLLGHQTKNIFIHYLKKKNTFDQYCQLQCQLLPQSHNTK